MLVTDVQFLSMYRLAGLGLPSKLDFLSDKPCDVAAVVNCMHTLVKQRQADKEVREQLEAENKKLRFENQVQHRVEYILLSV
jgi:hypothetical protein